MYTSNDPAGITAEMISSAVGSRLLGPTLAARNELRRSVLRGEVGQCPHRRHQHRRARMKEWVEVTVTMQLLRFCPRQEMHDARVVELIAHAMRLQHRRRALSPSDEPPSRRAQPNDAAAAEPLGAIAEKIGAAGGRGIDVGAQLGQGTIGQVGCKSFDDHVSVFEQRLTTALAGTSTVTMDTFRD